MKNRSFLLRLVGGALLLAALLWSPIFIIFTVKESKLETDGKEVAGRVVGHRNTIKYQRPVYYATVSYAPEGTDYFLELKGAGANPIRLPQGEKVKVRYLPNEPAFARAAVADASSGEPFPWQVLLALWCAAALCFTVAKFMRPNPAFQRTASGGR